MKYIRGEFHTPIESLIHGKTGLTMPDGFSENLWIGRSVDMRDANKVVLLNNALIFLPFPSWGMILSQGGDMSNIRAKEEITLHPEAFDNMVQRGDISEAGEVLLADYEEMLKVYRSTED